MITRIVPAIVATDPDNAVVQYNQALKAGEDPWDIHQTLFAAAQSVLNPPFINPHLSKMYAVIRELGTYLEKSDLPPLIRLEIAEYARRPQLEIPPRSPNGKQAISFNDIETAVGYRDVDLTAHYLFSFLEQHGGVALARKLLLLGGGYLQNSLGHSVSCTAFILLEMLHRIEAMNQPRGEAWPVLYGLAHYFCQGGFDTVSIPESSPQPLAAKGLVAELKRAASGYGVVNLHHTITLYATVRIQSYLTDDQYGRLVRAGIDFVGVKTPSKPARSESQARLPDDYQPFLSLFNQKKVEPILSLIVAMAASEASRRRLGRYLIKAVCDLYQGDYDPHYLTGLGSALWIMERYGEHTDLVAATFDQYLNYFFAGL